MDSMEPEREPHRADGQAVRSLTRSVIDDVTLMPVLGIVMAFAGFGLAVAFIPGNWTPPGALRTSGLAYAACLLVAPLASSLRNPKAIFRVEHILVLSPIYWLLMDIIEGQYELAWIRERELLVMTFLLIAVFVSACWIGAAVFRPRPPESMRAVANINLDPRVLFRLVLLFFALSFLSFAIPSNFDIVRMFQALGENRWSAPWARGTAGGWGAFIEHLGYFGYVLPCMTVLLAHKSGWRNPGTIVAVCCSVIITLFLAQGGGRRIPGVVAGSAVLFWILLRPVVNLRTILVFGGLTVALLMAFNVLLAYRNIGYKYIFTDVKPERFRPVEGIRVDDNFLRLAQVIAYFPDRQDFVYHRQVIFVLVRPVPRVLWPGKPMDPGYSLPDLLGRKGVSLSHTTIGEAWVSFGFLAVVFAGILYGFLARFLTEFLRITDSPDALLLYAFGGLVLFAGFRSQQDLVLMSYGLLFWFLTMYRIANSPSARQWLDYGSADA